MPARASAPKPRATAVVSFMLIIEKIGYRRSEKRAAGVNVVLDRTNEGDGSVSPEKKGRDAERPKNWLFRTRRKENERKKLVEGSAIAFEPRSSARGQPCNQIWGSRPLYRTSLAGSFSVSANVGTIGLGWMCSGVSGPRQGPRAQASAGGHRSAWHWSWSKLDQSGGWHGQAFLQSEPRRREGGVGAELKTRSNFAHLLAPQQAQTGSTCRRCMLDK